MRYFHRNVSRETKKSNVSRETLLENDINNPI